jgi:transcriptional regulator with XRE-family HTH domain
MGRAGKVLKTVLEKYEISQGKLAAVMGVGSSNVYRWANEIRDPSSETVIAIVEALKTVNDQAAEEFAALYFGDILKNQEY